MSANVKSEIKPKDKPTPEQHDAIHIRDRNLVVVASAGSGKTRVLVQRYLQMLEVNPEWPLNALVAITFSREAAYEMRQRLREELEERAREDPGAQWARHLAQMDSARIDTIHGLCADILRANAAHAGLDPKFEVLDETDAAILLSETVDDVLAAIEAPHDQLFAHYDAGRIRETLNRMDLVGGEHPPQPEEPDALFQSWLQEWSRTVFAARERLLASEEAVALAHIGFLPAGDKLSELVTQYERYVLKIGQADDARDICRMLESCRRDGAVHTKGSVKKWGSPMAKDAAAKLLRDLRARIADTLKEVGDMPGAIDRLAAQMLPLWRQLLGTVRETYRARKDADARLDFDDLERLAAEALAAPAVQTRYRNAEFKHLLVDEFQDTNRAQWSIIKALADLNRGGSLFVVGDPKQSIYQFRGADVSAFGRAKQEIAARAGGSALNLSVSFRSHPNLVDQFNKLFEILLTPDEDGAAPEYEVALGKPMKAFRKKSPPAPSLELLLLDRDRSEGNAADMRRWEAHEIVDRVAAWRKEGRKEGRRVFDKETGQWRKMEYGDIAILFQAMSNVGIYEDVLKSRGIPFLTIAGRGYFDRQEVWDVLALLRFLHNPADDLSLATVLRSPLFAFSDDLLFALRLIVAEDRRAPAPLFSALSLAESSDAPGISENDRPLLRQALDTLTDLRQVAGRLTISELLRRALAETDYLAILTGLHDGERRRGNVEKLLDLAQDSGKVTLEKFSVYLNDLSAREVREGEAHVEAGDALRLMTVHASKGLEFPAVILADASWTRRSPGAATLLADPAHGLSCQVYDPDANEYANGFAHRRNLKLQAHREAAERKRLLYVAATRAQDYLLASGQTKRNKAEQWTAAGWLGRLIAALDLAELPSEVQQTRKFAGECISVRMPLQPPTPESRSTAPQSASDMRDLEIAVGERPADPPRLLEPLSPYRSDAGLHIQATQLAQLGEDLRGRSEGERRAALQQFYEGVQLGPAEPEADLNIQRRSARPRLIGAIVHAMVQYEGYAAIASGSRSMIESIAWGHGLTNPGALKSVENEVRSLLRAYMRSKAHQWINEARADGRPVYTELPFIYRRNGLVIHGVIDVLLMGADGVWRVIDHKTSAVSGEKCEEHAQQYRLQLGAYAAAAQERLKLESAPQAYVHYLRANRIIPLASDDCIAELEELESVISGAAAHEG